jgi:hypothetical protein
MDVVNVVVEHVTIDHVPDLSRNAKERRADGVVLSAVITVSCRYIDYKLKVLHLVKCCGRLSLIAELLPLRRTRSLQRVVLRDTFTHDEGVCE